MSPMSPLTIGKSLGNCVCKRTPLVLRGEGELLHFVLHQLGERKRFELRFGFDRIEFGEFKKRG